MKRTIFHIAAAILCISSCSGEFNVKGKVSADGTPLEGVLVSDGISFTSTDSKGRYRLSSPKTTAVVFAITPSGYVAESEDGLQPQFWALLTQDPAVCEKHDFHFKPQDQSRYGMVFLTDEHLCNSNDKPDHERWENEMLPLLNARKEAMSKDMPVYMMNLGDLSHDRFWYEFGFTVREARDYLVETGLKGPLYSVSGNHDHDPAVYTEDRAEEEFLASHAYRETFGPAYYSFNAGDDHWVVMNDMQYINYPGNKKRYPGVVGDRNYSGNYTDAQIAWLEKDLEYVPDGTKVYLCSHAPIYKAGEYRFPLEQLEKLDSIFAAHNTVCTMFSGHTHRMSHVYDTKFPHIETVNLPATSGNMWETSAVGQTLSIDGTAAGAFCAVFGDGDKSDYSFHTPDGVEKYHRCYDMNAVNGWYAKDSLMNVIRQLCPEEQFPAGNRFRNCVAVNFWWYTEGDSVEFYEDGKLLPSSRANGMADPLSFCHFYRRRYGYKGDFAVNPARQELLETKMFVARTRRPDTPVKVVLRSGDGKVIEDTIMRPGRFDMDFK